MSEIVKTLKLRLYTTETENSLFQEFTKVYANACNEISDYIFQNGFILNFMKLQEALYSHIRESYPLKSQMTISVFKTVTARYKTAKTQLSQNPYKYKDENNVWHTIPKTLEWLQKPISFKRPQADLVRNRDYSFVDGNTKLSINTLAKRVKVSFLVPKCFQEYFDGSWSFGTGKLVSLQGIWYLHIAMTKENDTTFTTEKPAHVVGIDRGIRFLATSYDEKGNTIFISGKKAMEKRNAYLEVRKQLQSKGTKSAKRVLKRLSGRENRFMTDVNHQISKALVSRYGRDTLFVLEDLTGVSFDEKNLSNLAKQNYDIRTWTFYQLEQFLTYKAEQVGSQVIKVSAAYTSQRCPKCGRIHKQNRHHDIHEYLCDACGYRSNDDRIGAMNIYTLGTMYVSGDTNPRFGVRKTN